MNILVFDSDSQTLDAIGGALSSLAAHQIDLEASAEHVLSLLDRNAYDLCIFEVHENANRSGFELLKTMRENGSATPTILISSDYQIESRLRGLKLGCEDYIQKPFLMEEFLLKVEVVLRRYKSPPTPDYELSYEDLKINVISREVFRSNRKIKLQTREFLLLEYLLKNKEEIVSKATILLDVLDYRSDHQTNVVDVLVHRLRAKIDRDFDLKLIHNIRGVGYSLRASEEI